MRKGQNSGTADGKDAKNRYLGGAQSMPSPGVSTVQDPKLSEPRPPGFHGGSIAGTTD